MKTTNATKEKISYAMIDKAKEQSSISRLVEPYRLELEYGFATASWNWDSYSSCHAIKVGDHIAVQLDADRRDKGSLISAVTALINHETCHGLYTERDGKAIKDAVRAARGGTGVPFRMFNLFEDCRIEHHGRHDGVTFGWLGLGFTRQRAPRTPMGLLFELCQAECSQHGDVGTIITKGMRGIFYAGSSRYVKHDGTVIDTLPTVVGLYLEACQAATTMDLMRVMERWVDVFGIDISEVPVVVGVSIDGENDPTDELVILQVDALKRNKGQTRYTVPVSHFIATVHPQACAVNRGIVDSVKAALMTFMNRQDVTPEAIGEDGSMLNLPGIISRDASSYWLRPEQVSDGKRNVLLVIDMSGSMQVFWHVGGGKEFCIALKELGDQGVINLDIVLSGLDYYTAIASPSMLPMDLASLHPASRDDMERSLNNPDVKPLIDKATTIIVWTDGQLTAGEQVGYRLARAGKRFVAASLNNSKKAQDAMFAHFPVAITDADPVIVASKIGQFVIESDNECIMEGVNL